MKRRISFIINRRINGKNKVIKQIKQVFFRDEILILETEYKYHAMVLAEQVSKESDYIIAVGGDGIVNEVVNGIMQLSSSDIEHLALGIVPSGSGNDFSKSIGMTKDLLKLRYLMDHKFVKKASVGYLDYLTDYGKISRRYFMNIAEVGIGGETVYRLEQRRNILGPGMKFVFSALQVFLTYKYPYVQIFSDSVMWRGRITLIAFANGRYFGGGLGIAPGASPFSDSLQLVVVEKVTQADFLKHMSSLRNAKKIDDPRIKYYDVKKVSIVPLDKNVLYAEADGEFLGKAPVEVGILPKKINLIYNPIS